MTSETVKHRDVILHGFCAPKYEGLRDAFMRNFVDLGEVGGSYTVVIGGEVVADLWGGRLAQEGEAGWERDTIVGIWSASKGLGATCFAMLVDRGLASYDDKVSRYWPEFGEAGKEDVTIGMLLSHQSGITGFATPATLEDLLSGEIAAARLIKQPPLWPLGSASGYSNVVGIFSTSLFQRIEGRSLRQFVKDELKGVFGLDISIGLEPEDKPRLADLMGFEAIDAVALLGATNEAQRHLHNPPMTGDLPNKQGFQDADIVAANGYGNARGLAKLYAMLLPAGLAGRRLIQDSALAEATRVWFDGIDMIRGMPRPWGAGYMLNHGGIWGPNREAFGHGGWGGAFGYADPVAGVAAGYAMNFMDKEVDTNPRRRNLIDSIYTVL
nr:serine hydrolase domain-containing protein [Sphingomonas sp. CDS-1]